MPQAELVYDQEKNVAYAGGIVIPLGRKPVAANQVIDNLKRALATDYTGKDERKKGLTKFDAMLMEIVEKAERGDEWAIDMVFNRILGRPVQQINSMNVNASLQEFLDGLNAPAPQTPGEEIDPFGD